MTEDYMTRAELDRYIDQKLRRNQRGGLGGILFTLACLIPIVLLVARVGPEVAVMYGVQLPLPATPMTVFSTAQPVALPPATIRQNPLPPIPTPRSVQPAVVAAPEQPAPPTATPAPTAFWTEEERAAFTATAEAWYDPATLPTAPPEFVKAVEEACTDPEQIAESAMLQLFCRK